MTDQPARSFSAGRPRKDGGERRTWRPNPRFTQAEREVIESAAAEAGVSPAAYIRHMTLTGRVVVQDQAREIALDRADLSRIGSNLNQIARHLNAGRNVPADAIEAALRSWHDLAAGRG